MVGALLGKRRRRGQGTVEYLLMLCAAVGQILALTVCMKKGLPKIFARIQCMVEGNSDAYCAQVLADGGGSGG